jgi:hypothetical protein
MAISTQLTKPWGFKKETTWGTPVTVDHFLPVVDFEPEGGPEPTYSDPIISGKLANEAAYVGLGKETYKWSVKGEAYDHGLDALFELWLGAVAITGSGPYTKTFTQASPQPGFTMQGGAPDITGVTRVLTYAGAAVESWQLAVEPGKRLTWETKGTAKTETNATAAATLTYASALVPVHAQNVTMSLWGSTVNCTGLKISGGYKLSDRRFLGSPTMGARQLNFVQYLRYKAGTTGVATAVVTVGSNTTTISFPTARIVEAHPKFSGRGVVPQPLTIEGLSSGASEAITIVTSNSDATP